MGLRDWHRYSSAVTRSPRWKALRLQALRRDGWKCVQCGGRGRLEVDHVQPVRDAPDKAFDLANLQCLCPACHGRKTRIEVGHPPLPQDRQDWRDTIAAMMRQKG